MNILYTSFYFPPDFQGGAEISAYNVGKGLVERDHTVHVLTRDAGAEYDDVFTVYDDLRSGELPKELVVRSTRNHVSRLLDEHDFDVVHAQNEYTAIGAAQACHGTDTPCAVSVRDYWLLDPLRICYDFEPGVYSTKTDVRTLLNRARNKYRYAGGKKRLLAPLIVVYLEQFRRYELKHICKADVLLANSNFMRSLHDDLHPNVRTLYNSIDTDTFQPLETEESEKTRLLFVGRMRPEKGILTLLEALSNIEDEAVVLDIVGTDAPPRWVADKIREYQIRARVNFRGRVPFNNLPQVYNGADIVVFPSEWQEPFGRISIEAMACGTPVIATNVGGIPEVVEDEETGVLVPPGDAEALSEAIQRLGEDDALRERLAENGQRHVLNTFSADIIAGQQEQGYTEVVESE